MAGYHSAARTLAQIDLNISAGRVGFEDESEDKPDLPIFEVEGLAWRRIVSARIVTGDMISSG